MKKLTVLTVTALLSLPALPARAQNPVVVENSEIRLEISPSGVATSLIHKPSGQECLDTANPMPLCTLTEHRPYDNELFLTYPAKPKTFGANRVERSGNTLRVGFELIAYTAIITLDVTDDYIGFTLTGLDYEVEKIGVKRRTEIDEFTLLQLPVRQRTHFGEWLNVVWDNNVAVNLLATDPYARIDASRNPGHLLLHAGMDNNVKLMDVGAALIVTSPATLLDRIDRLEKDRNLPRGVESRRRPEYKYSYYELRDVTTANIDRHIAYARQGGFRMIVIYYPDFSHAMGHFPWRNSYPNGMADLQTITRKIKEAGMVAGFHIHYNKAAKNDAYVSPVPDGRLNLVRMFTLAEGLGATDTVIRVEENPEGCTMEDERRFLKIGNELVTYTDYTTTPPYEFRGCSRGELGSTGTGAGKGFKFGLLDVDTWPLFIRFDQNTSIQAEVAARLGEIYAAAGFQFVYFDGAEDVPPPYWHNVSKSQLMVYNAMKPAPLLSEGALKSHFGWHILSRGNAFDLFRPEDIRTATNRYTVAAARFIAQDFTSINFGWNDYLAPSDSSVGMQPDMYEYICSRGAAWDSPISLMGKLGELDTHPRTRDNLEVIRNWENMRISGRLSDEQKEMLRDTTCEHFLFTGEPGEPELLPYTQIEGLPGSLRAFVFTRHGVAWIVYWDTHGSSTYTLPETPGKTKITLTTTAGKRVPLRRSAGRLLLPADNRHYIKTNLTTAAATQWFAAGEVR
jgi:hypothetical protein